jgi:YtkA-like
VEARDPAAQQPAHDDGHGNDAELTELDADIETQQGTPELAGRQPEFGEGAREAESMHQSEEKHRDDPPSRERPKVQVLHGNKRNGRGNQGFHEHRRRGHHPGSRKTQGHRVRDGERRYLPEQCAQSRGCEVERQHEQYVVQTIRQNMLRTDCHVQSGGGSETARLAGRIDDGAVCRRVCPGLIECRQTCTQLGIEVALAGHAEFVSGVRAARCCSQQQHEAQARSRLGTGGGHGGNVRKLLHTGNEAASPPPQAYNAAMDLARARGLTAIVVLLLAGLPAVVQAHGGVVADEDLCIIKIGYLKAHFKIYVPQVTGLREYCEDIPVRGASIFVMEYLHDSLASTPISFRIIRNTTGKGAFARLADVEALPDLDAVTVHYAEPGLVPDVYTLAYDFERDGNYIGIVTAGGADPSRTYTAVFPFAVGAKGLGIWPWLLMVLAALQLHYFYWRRKRPLAAAALLLLLCLVPAGHPLFADAVRGVSGVFVVDWTPSIDPIGVNRMHSWDLEVRDRAGEPVDDARISIEGGMPAHDHGLATTPRITWTGEPGHYRIDGLRFHMPGTWLVVLTISADGHRDRVEIRLTV